MPEKPVEVTLNQLTYGGDALGRLADGRVVFVPFGIPGERVLVQVSEERRGYARATLVEVVEPSPQRIQPRCVHFGVCGGCHYQHMPYQLQLEAKQAILTDLLQRSGGIRNPPVRDIVPSPNEYGYRNHIQFHLDLEGRLGCQAAASHQVIAIQECHLPETPLNDVWPRMDFDATTGIQRVSLRLGDEEEVMLVLESQSPMPPDFNVDFPLSAIHLSSEGTVVLSGESALRMTILGHPFQVSSSSFFQVNSLQAENMVRYLMERLPLDKKQNVLDLYCGVGLFSAFIAPRVNQLTGIELSEAACEDFAVNLDEFTAVSLYQGSVEAILPELRSTTDVIVADPPRAGMPPRAIEAIAHTQASTLAYVSCDPATLARDARRLSAFGYQMVECTPFDLFPQTYHIESISIFQK